MSIENNYEILTYTATEGQTDFLVTWDYQEEDDIFFLINNDDTVRKQEKYTVTEDGISLNNPLKAGDKVVIYRETDLEQIVEFLTNGKITATMLQNHSDNIYSILQELHQNSINPFNLDIIKDLIPEVPDFQDYSKYGVSSGVVSGMQISNENGQLKIAEGLGFLSNANRYNSYKDDITLTSLELTEPLYYTDFTNVTDGLKHVILSNNNFITLSETKPITSSEIYLGYCYVVNESLSSVFSCPNILANSQERLNNHIDSNIKFENVNLSLKSIPNALGLELEPNTVIYAAGNNYNGAINQFQQTNVDKFVNVFATNSFKQFCYNNDGTAQEMVELNSVNINRNIIDKIDDETNNYSDKNLINNWQNLRICLSKKGELAVTRGQVDYNSQQEALEALSSENFVIQPSYSDFYPVYALTIQAGAIDYSDVILTKLYTYINGVIGSEFSVDDLPVGTLYTAHESLFEGNDKWIYPLTGQTNLDPADYPELSALQGYVKDAITEEIIENVIELDYFDTLCGENSRVKGYFESGNTHYAFVTSNDISGTYLIKSLDGFNWDIVMTIPNPNIAYVAAKDPSNVIVAENNGIDAHYMIDIVNATFNELTMPADLDSQMGYSIFHYNENISKWVRAYSNTSDNFVIETSTDGFVWSNEYTNPAFHGINTIIQYSKTLIQGTSFRYQKFNFKGTPNYINGKYYLVDALNSRIISFNENNLTTFTEEYNDFTYFSDPNPIVIKGNLGVMSHGFDGVYAFTTLIDFSSGFPVFLEKNIYFLDGRNTGTILETYIIDNNTIMVANKDGTTVYMYEINNIDSGNYLPANMITNFSSTGRTGIVFISLTNENKLLQITSSDFIEYDRVTTGGATQLYIQDFTSNDSNIDPDGRHVTALKAKP